MANRDPLARLADLYGIEPNYVDIWNRRHPTRPDTRRALLDAMGVPAATPSEVAESLRRAEERPWRRTLAPVWVFGEGEPLVPTFTISGNGPSSVIWRLIQENGEVTEGRAKIGDLPAVASHALDGTRYGRHRLPLGKGLAPGYHRLSLTTAGGRSSAVECESSVIVAPARCYTPGEGNQRSRLWGFSLQLYALRSRRNWGMGDFGDLARLAVFAKQTGADTIGINPIHALFPADPGHYGPYGPSSRLFLNVLYIDVRAVPDIAESPEARAMVVEPAFRNRLKAARQAAYLDYPAVAALKMPVLEALYRSFKARHLGREPTRRGHAFRGFQQEMGEELARHALFEALHEHFFTADPGKWSWRTWPGPYQNHASTEVAAFARDHADRVEFFQYLQWLADQQLDEAQRAALSAGMKIGLYRDLAVGASPGGSMPWSFPDVVLSGASLGAPPDDFNLLGQNWGLAALSPAGLREAAYRPFIGDLRANMRHAGALRIDHAMALKRLYWIPEGATPAEGAYVRYPFGDMLRIVALQSQRHRCLVIGEDLGTLPEGFRPAMQKAGVFSYRPFYFERRKDGSFTPPKRYPAQALVTASTHDLPTVVGFWLARDLDWRHRLGLFPSAQAYEEAVEKRRRARQLILDALTEAGVEGWNSDTVARFEPPMDHLIRAVYRFLATTPSRLLMVQVEDALGEVDQANLPATRDDQHPNWRRRLRLSLEHFFADPGVQALAALTREQRPAGRGAGRKRVLRRRGAA